MLRSGVAALVTLAALACDGGLQPQDGCPAGICGTVTIRGMPPAETDGVFILAYQTFPQTCNDIPSFLPFPNPPRVSLTDTIASYTLAVPDGQYAWIVAAWKRVGTLTLTPADTALLREAGYYRDPANPLQPGAVMASGGVEHIDFVVDLNNLHPITDYLTCAVR
jgi:hypothetical protein